MIEKLSIVIPLYNKEKNIGRTVESVLSQTVSDWQLYIVNDGSSDGGPAIVEGFEDSRIHLIHQNNAGVSIARNRGVEAAGEGLVVFLDADDFWESVMLEELLSLRDAFPDAGMYSTGYRRIDEHGKGYSISIDPKDGDQQLVRDYIGRTVYGNFVHTSCVMLPFNVLRDVGGFPSGEKFNEDLVVWAKASLLYPVACSTRICGNYYCDTREVAPRHGRGFTKSPLVELYAEVLESGSLGNQSRESILSALRAKLWQGTGYLLNANAWEALRVWTKQPALLKYGPWILRYAAMPGIKHLLKIVCGLRRRRMPSSRALREGFHSAGGVTCLKLEA